MENGKARKTHHQFSQLLIQRAKSKQEIDSFDESYIAYAQLYVICCQCHILMSHAAHVEGTCKKLCSLTAFTMLSCMLC